jgi:hypothetical protein
MSDLLNSLNVPSAEPPKSWAQEVAEAGAADAPAGVTEAVAANPAPDVAPAPEAAPEPSQQQEAAPEEHDRRVPLKALQEERAKRAEYERKLAEYERQMAEMKGYFAAMQERGMGHNGGPPMDQPAQAEPDPETDPIGALKHAREQLRQMQEQTAQQQYAQQLNAVAYQAATTFKAQVPDYTDAYQYAINSRAQELAALGTPQDAIPSILQREELTLIDTAVRNGKNPAEAIYHFAKARGFQGKPAAPNPALQQQKAAVAASASAGGAPAAKGEMSINDIANLKGAAFDAAWNKLFGGNKSSMFRE